MAPAYAELVGKAARAALVDVPAEVFERLTGAHKQAIVDVFTGLLLRNKLGVVGAMATAMGMLPESLRTGETLFPGFSASTVAPGDGGWKKRLARWFART